MLRLIFLLFAVSTFAAAVEPSDEAAFSAAAKLVNIFAADDKPFQLEIDFEAQNSVAGRGHLSWKWSAKDLWWREVTIGDFRQVEVRKGDTRYITRNAGFTPLRARQLEMLIKVFTDDSEKWQVKKIKRETLNSIESDCMKIQPRSGKPYSDREICIDRTTGEILTDREKSPYELRVSEFSEYQAFGAYRYPRQFKLSLDASPVMKAHVVSLQEASFEPALFMPPVDAIVRRECEGKIQPRAIKTLDPAYPPSARRTRSTGTAVVAITVQTDGSVDNPQLIESAGHELDQSTLETVKKWKFKPAMCGTEPVTTDVQVEVNFRLD